MTKRCVTAGLVVVALLMMCGCGRKGFPVASVGGKEPPTVGKIGAQVFSDGVEISWDVPQGTESNTSDYPYCFIVERAEIPWEGMSCQECPALAWVRSECFHPAYPGSARWEKGKMIWKDTQVAVKRAYRYQVAMHDRASNRLVVTSKFLDVQVHESPDVIKRVGAKASDKGILLEWFVCPDSCKNIEESLAFQVDRRKGAEPWASLTDEPYRKTSYLDGAVEPGGIYDYRVTPYYVVNGVAIWGKPAVVSRIKSRSRLLPPPPETVWVVPGKNGLEVHWLEVKGKEQVLGYNIYRKQQDGNIVRLNDKPVEHSPFVDKNAAAGAVYGYAVSSVASDATRSEGVTSSWIEIRNVFTKPK